MIPINCITSLNTFRSQDRMLPDDLLERIVLPHSILLRDDEDELGHGGDHLEYVDVLPVPSLPEDL